MKEKIQEAYNSTLEQELIDEIVQIGQISQLSAGDTIIDYGDELRGLPLVIDGAMKILTQDEKGDELALYYLERGDTCTMSMTCCMGQKKSNIRAVGETDVLFVTVPVNKMKEWTQKYESWMTFVFESYSSRFDELLSAVDNLAFNDMYARLHLYLKDQVMVKKSMTLELSHQDIAYDMHTSRVVISRLLKRLENDGIIELGRNKINLIHF